MDKKLTKDLFIIAFSIVIAIILVKTNAVATLINSTREFVIITSFLTGIFYVSLFTVVPASVAIAEIAQKTSPLLIAFIGAFGSLLGDYIIFRYIKNNLSEYVVAFAKKLRRESILKSQMFRFCFSFVGAVVIASPLPDEIGLGLMGITKIRTKYFVPISYSLNFIGILVIALIGKAVN